MGRRIKISLREDKLCQGGRRRSGLRMNPLLILEEFTILIVPIN